MIPATRPQLPPMSHAAIKKVRRFEADLLANPQPFLATHHTLHAGIYTRTVKLRAGSRLTGALIKIPTTLTLVGDVTVFVGDDTIELSGYNVLAASAGRKQAFVAHTDVALTMMFATQAKTIEEAENEFTDEAHLLLSRQQPEHDTVVITGE
jgi:hypothetical protein